MYKWAVSFIFLALAWRILFQKDPQSVEPLEAYDYVVVGAGSAGGIIAARLSEDSHRTVALLEAGPDNDEFPEADVPLNFFDLQKTDVDWQYETVPQNYSCQGLVGKRSAWPRGKALGGSSLINAMMVTRCSKYDYDLWAEMGNKEWSYEKVLPFFKKIETVTKQKWKTSGYRGLDGPVNIEEPNPFPELTKAILEAAESNGFKAQDINDKDMLGWMVYQANQDHGVRESTARAYIKPAMERSNLHVITKAHTTKVIFEGKRAVGVEYLHDGRMKTVRANKEVILSAGAIGSPQILMLSGVGPKKHLQDLNIPVLADLPVGQNLLDHLMVDAPVYTFDKPVALVKGRLGILTDLEYQLFGTGPLSTSGVIATGFTKASIQPKNKHNPFLQYIVFGDLMGNHPDVYNTMEKVLNMEPKIFKALNSGNYGRDGITMLTKLLQPYSKGEIRLKSTNPFDYPIIDPNYLSDERDVKIFVEGIRIAQQVLDKPAMKAIGAKRLERVNPICADHKYDSDEYWACFVRSNTLTVYHPTTTCKMGPKEDPTSVVDSDLRVKNVEGLRVADASIMPYITSGNTNFPSMMIGEKAADIIKRQS